MRANHVATLCMLGAMMVVAFTGQTWMAAIARGEAADVAAGAVDSNGRLRVPRDYRSTYQFLGSWAIADNSRGAKELHIVYASPGVAEAYRKDGRFPKGAVLVKEVFSTTTSEMTTGSVSRAQELKGWFVMTKDSGGPREIEKLWGDGWGWAWFDAAEPSKTTSTDYKSDCLSCHVPARASDWVYVDGYPALRH